MVEVFCLVRMARCPYLTPIACRRYRRTRRETVCGCDGHGRTFPPPSVQPPDLVLQGGEWPNPFNN